MQVSVTVVSPSATDVVAIRVNAHPQAIELGIRMISEETKSKETNNNHSKQG